MSFAILLTFHYTSTILDARTIDRKTVQTRESATTRHVARVAENALHETQRSLNETHFLCLKKIPKLSLCLLDAHCSIDA